MFRGFTFVLLDSSVQTRICIVKREVRKGGGREKIGSQLLDKISRPPAPFHHSGASRSPGIILRSLLATIAQPREKVAKVFRAFSVVLVELVEFADLLHDAFDRFIKNVKQLAGAAVDHLVDFGPAPFWEGSFDHGSQRLGENNLIGLAVKSHNTLQTLGLSG